jgi:hypothetical protein
VEPAVWVEWDYGRCFYVAGCDRCAETITLTLLADAHEWAETHRCDPELAALLSTITTGTRRRAA